MKSTCRHCNKVILKEFSHYRTVKRKDRAPYKVRVFLDDSNRQWRGGKCPNCAHGAVEIHKCLKCGESFKKAGKTPKKFCSRKCFTDTYYPNKARKPRSCKNSRCKNKAAKGRLYCSTKCSDRSKKAYNRLNRMHRKYKKKNATPAWCKPSHFKKLLLERPKGYHLDHIIPINHPDVCGLHVPWNIQYLSAGDNIRKSNKFDGTMDNISWKD